MARPREFDEVTVLEAAMNCFWAQGFESTSVRDLAEQMGIIGTSLYNAFGDKRSLYRQVLAHYLETSVRDRVSRLEKLPPLPAIRAFFEEVIQLRVSCANGNTETGETFWVRNLAWSARQKEAR